MNKPSDKLMGISAALLVQTLLMISPALAEGSTDLVRAEDAIVLVNPMVDDFGRLTVKRLLTCGQRAGLDAHLIQMHSGSVNSNLPGFDLQLSDSNGVMELEFVYPYTNPPYLEIRGYSGSAVLATVYRDGQVYANNYNDLELDYQALRQVVMQLVAAC